MPTFFDKSENERDRITRLSQRDKEKYAEEALEYLNERGKGEQFGKMMEEQFNIFGPDGEPKATRRKRRPRR